MDLFSVFDEVSIVITGNLIFPVDNQSFYLF